MAVYWFFMIFSGQWTPREQEKAPGSFSIPRSPLDVVSVDILTRIRMAGQNGAKTRCPPPAAHVRDLLSMS